MDFDLWKGEADADPYIPDMVAYLKDNGYAYLDQGALVVDVKEESDAKEIPPCMILKSDGASLYNTTDLATIVQRMEDYHPDEMIYVVDKRQELHLDVYKRQAVICVGAAALAGTGIWYGVKKMDQTKVDVYPVADLKLSLIHI